jgi:AraC-like DNA-binding protein
MEWLEYISQVVNIVGGGSWTKGFTEPDRVIYDHELVLFSAGKCLLTVNGKQYQCQAPYWFIIPPGTAHRTTAVSDEVYRYWVHFDWLHTERNISPICTYVPEKPDAKLIRTAPAFVPDTVLHGKISDVRKIIPLIKKMAAAREKGTPLDRKAARGTLLEILIRLIGHDNEFFQGSRQVRNEMLASLLKSHLEKMPPQNVEIRAYIRELGYSYGHLCRIFKEHYGLAPLNFLNILRLEAAAAELSKAKTTVAEAGEKGGFNDPAYFSRIFKKHFGMPPSEWRARRR